jgi:hypothetical protein
VDGSRIFTWLEFAKKYRSSVPLERQGILEIVMICESAFSRRDWLDSDRDRE